MCIRLRICPSVCVRDYGGGGVRKKSISGMNLRSVTPECLYCNNETKGLAFTSKINFHCIFSLFQYLIKVKILVI